MQLREVKVKHILNRSALKDDGYTINPYIGCQHACVYCYACFMKRLSNHQEPWGQFADAKVNAVEVFEKDFHKVKDGERAFIGSATDAYQPLEIKYKLTRGILQKIIDIRTGSFFPKDFSVSILTKSDIVLRDIDLLKRIPNAEVGFSITVPNEKARRFFEPKTTPVKQRFAALEKLRQAGIATFSFIGPILPGITELEFLFAALENKVNYVFGETLNTGCGNMPQILQAIDLYDKELRPFFVRTVENRSYWESVEEEFYRLAEEHGIEVAGFFHHISAQ